MPAPAVPEPRSCSRPTTYRRPFISIRPAPTSSTSRGSIPPSRSRASSRHGSSPVSREYVPPRSSIFDSAERSSHNLTRILAIADEVDEGLYGDKLLNFKPDIVLSCGDLPPDYLEYIVSRLNVPLLYVPGNHDPDFRPVAETWSPLRAEPLGKGPQGRVNVDGRVEEAAALRIAALGGSMRYRPGPNQY